MGVHLTDMEKNPSLLLGNAAVMRKLQAISLALVAIEQQLQ